MPLIPMPPMPTKCTCRVLPSTRELQRLVDHYPGRVRPGQRARRGRNLPPPRPIGGERENPFGQRRAAEFALQQYLRGAARGERLGVLPLMVVGGGRQRNQDRRLAGGGEFR